jgi:putative transposase
VSNKVFEYKLNPNKAEIQAIESMLWETKCIYNRALEQKINHYKEKGEYLNFFVQDKDYNTKTCPNVPSVLVDTTLARMEESFKNFFRGLREGKKIGFPRFQSIKRWSSFKFRDYTMGKLLEKDGKWYWKLFRTTAIKVNLHRPFVGKPKYTQLVKRADGYYVQLVVELPEVESKPVNNNSKAVGLDVGIKWFVADSEGNKIKSPKHFRANSWKLAHNQRAMSKLAKGGKNRNKKRKLVAKLHLKTTRQRKDFIHKVASSYANNYDIVCVEKLNIKGMVRNHCLALSINDSSWGLLFQLLEYKLQTLAKRLIKVDPKYTSQICPKCGAIAKKSLSQRTHYCPECLYTEDRDVASGHVILARGLKSIGLERAFGESATLVEALNQEAHGSLAHG